MADMAVQIPPLETSQDWAPWSKGIRTKLEWHNLYKYIQTDLAMPTGSDNQAFLRQEKWEADQARTKAILRTSCSDVVQNKINEYETADTTVFEIFTFLKEKYSKQNVFSLGTLHRTITKAKLNDYPNLKEYGKAITEAGERLNQLGHPVESWILSFYFLDGLGQEYEIFRQSQNAKYAEASIKPPTTKTVNNKVIIEEDTSGYTKIEDLLQILLQDQANKVGSTASGIAMRAGPSSRGRGSGRRGSSRGAEGAAEVQREDRVVYPSVEAEEEYQVVGTRVNSNVLPALAKDMSIQPAFTHTQTSLRMHLRGNILTRRRGNQHCFYEKPRTSRERITRRRGSKVAMEVTRLLWSLHACQLQPLLMKQCAYPQTHS